MCTTYEVAYSLERMKMVHQDNHGEKIAMTQ